MCKKIRDFFASGLENAEKSDDYFAFLLESAGDDSGEHGTG
jgi:hypothetical protein